MAKKINRRIDLGEYVIRVNYDPESGDLEVKVLDELGGLIESINITTDENPEDEPEDMGMDISLN